MAAAKNNFSIINKLSAQVALFSLALIIIAPLISTFLHSQTMPMMSATMHHPPSSTENPHANHRQGQMPNEGTEACGYCVLLVHVPGLLLLAGGLATPPLLALFEKIVHLTLQTRHDVAWLQPHTRAPPQ